MMKSQSWKICYYYRYGTRKSHIGIAITRNSYVVIASRFSLEIMRTFLSHSWFALVAGITWDLRDTNGNLIKDRQQWQNNDAYSAETSFIMAGMHLAGQYVSQYDVRAANSGLSDCAAQRNSLSMSLRYQHTPSHASDQLKLRYAYYRPPGGDLWSSNPIDVSLYLGWIKAQLRQGHAPTISVYCKDCGLKYDLEHIMTAISYESTFNDDLFHAGDAFTYCDHLGAYPNRRGSRPSGRRLAWWGLAFNLFRLCASICPEEDDTDDGRYAPSDWQAIVANGGIDASSCTRIVVNSLTSPLFGSRYDADARTSSSYTIPNDKHNSGIAHLGPVDLNNELLRVEMTSDKTFEAPEIESVLYNPDGPRPASMDLTLTITVKGLSTDTTKQYVLCLADSLASIVEPSIVEPSIVQPHPSLPLFSPPRCPLFSL